MYCVQWISIVLEHFLYILYQIIQVLYEVDKMALSIIDALEEFVGVEYNVDSIRRFEESLRIPDNTEERIKRFDEIDRELMGLATNDSIELGLFYQRYMASSMKYMMEREEDLTRIIGYQPDPDMSFADPNPIPRGLGGNDSPLLSKLFLIKYNQIRRVRFIGYDLPPLELAIIQSDNPYDRYIEMLDVKMKQLMADTNIQELDMESLLILHNEIYKNSEGLSMPTYYLARVGDVKQINLRQIESITNSIIDMVVNENMIARQVLIVALDRVATAAMNVLNTINYLTIASDANNDGLRELRGIKFEVFGPADLSIDFSSSMLVPSHRRMSSEEVDELLERTGWTLDSLQGLSINDPVVKFMAFNIDDIIEIKRPSAVGMHEISDHSYAYRIVRPMPLYISSDNNNMNKFMRNFQ